MTHFTRSRRSSGFLVDDGGDPSLASVSADVRFDWDVDQQAFAIGLGWHVL